MKAPLQDVGGESQLPLIGWSPPGMLCGMDQPRHSIATAHAIVCVRTLALMECHYVHWTGSATMCA